MSRGPPGGLDPVRRGLLRLAAMASPLVAVTGALGCTGASRDDPDASAVPVTDFGVGGGDDAAALRRALATGRAVRIPDGVTLTVGSDVVLPPGQTLFGAGAGSRIRLVSNCAPDNVKLVLSSRTTVRDFHVEEVGATGRTGLYGTIFADGASHCSIRRVEVSGSSSAGMLFIASADILVEDCRVHDTMADGIHAQRGSRRIAVVGCRIHRTGDDGIAFVSHGLDRHPRVSECVARDCTITDVVGTGSGVAVIGAVDVSVDRCRIAAVPMSGIRIASAAFGAEGSAIGERIAVTGNIIERSGQGVAAGDDGGIFVEGCRDVTVDRNRIAWPRSWGIATSNIVRDVRITDNLVFHPGDVGLFISAARGDRAYAEMWGRAAPATRRPPYELIIAGNRIVAPLAAGIHIWGQSDHPIADVLVRDNIVEAIRPIGRRAGPVPGGIRIGDATRVTARGNRETREETSAPR